MTVLITGGTGFIGSNLANLFGNPTICDVDDRGRPDVFYPQEIIDQLRAGSRVDAVYHLGAISSTTETNTGALTSNNIMFSCQLMEECVYRGIPFVYASSASVYGLGEYGFSESSRLSPLNYYAISKASFDMIAKKKIEDNPGAKIVGLRYFNVYGHGENHKLDQASPVHKFFNQSKAGSIKLFEGSENFKRDFVHVNDIARITKEAIEFDSGIYNAGTGTARSFLEVAEIVSKITGAQIHEIPFPRHLVGKYQDFTCSDNSKIDMAYKSNRISLEEGVRITAGEMSYD